MHFLYHVPVILLVFASRGSARTVQGRLAQRHPSLLAPILPQYKHDCRVWSKKMRQACMKQKLSLLVPCLVVALELILGFGRLLRGTCSSWALEGAGWRRRLCFGRAR